MPESRPCPICGAAAAFAIERGGKVTQRTFHIYRCDHCGFVFVGDPWLEYSQIYSEDYYLGRGADPLVDYVGEAKDPRSIRVYEWSGILRWVQSQTTLSSSTRWLDFGAGTGGLVRFVRDSGYPETFGYDQSLRAPRVEGYEKMRLDSLEGQNGAFDVITAIEVLEHLPDPIAELTRIRELLAPGGLLFITTTNSAPHKNDLASWRYIVPEVHVSFFDPPALARALREAGFTPVFPGFADGWSDIIRYKVLKNLGCKHSSLLERMVPWRAVSRLVDRRHALSAQPIGRV